MNRAEWDKSHLWESVPEGRRAQADAALYSSKVRSFERGVENTYIQRLRNDVSVPSSSPLQSLPTSLSAGGQAERGAKDGQPGLTNQCEYFKALQQQQISQEAGFFGIGANYEKIRQIRAEKNPSCEQLRDWGLQHNQGATF